MLPHFVTCTLFSRSSMVFARAVVFVFLFYFFFHVFAAVAADGCVVVFVCCNSNRYNRSQTKLFQCFAWVYYINWVLTELNYYCMWMSMCFASIRTKWSTAISYIFPLLRMRSTRAHRIFCSFFIMCFLGRSGRASRESTDFTHTRHIVVVLYDIYPQVTYGNRLERQTQQRNTSTNTWL